MRTSFKLFLAAAALVMGGKAMAMDIQDEMPSKEVTIGLNDVYVPGGFDSSTAAYVVVSGMFPNGCYKWKGAEVKNTGTFRHEIVTKATVSQGMCLMVLVPFSKDVKLGKLDAGTHVLRFLNGDGTYFEKSMNIE